MSWQFGGDPNRPYTGQKHTFAGERGKAPVPSHLTMRDLGDVIHEKYLEQVALAKKFESGIDPDALVQSILSEIDLERHPKCKVSA